MTIMTQAFLAIYTSRVNLDLHNPWEKASTYIKRKMIPCFHVTWNEYFVYVVFIRHLIIIAMKVGCYLISLFRKKFLHTHTQKNDNSIIKLKTFRKLIVVFYNVKYTNIAIMCNLKYAYVCMYIYRSIWTLIQKIRAHGVFIFFSQFYHKTDTSV